MGACFRHRALLSELLVEALWRGTARFRMRPPELRLPGRRQLSPSQPRSPTSMRGRPTLWHRRRPEPPPRGARCQPHSLQPCPPRHCRAARLLRRMSVHLQCHQPQDCRGTLRQHQCSSCQCMCHWGRQRIHRRSMDVQRPGRGELLATENGCRLQPLRHSLVISGLQAVAPHRVCSQAVAPGCYHEPSRSCRTRRSSSRTSCSCSCSCNRSTSGRFRGGHPHGAVAAPIVQHVRHEPEAWSDWCAESSIR